VSIGVKVTVLVGGVGGARFLLGVQHVLGLGQFAARGGGQFAARGGGQFAARGGGQFAARGGGQFAPSGSGDHALTAIVNVGDDAWMHGVRICPDLDTCMYTLGGGIDPERGWGHRGETWHAMEELAAYGVQPDWFSLGDRDLATHLVRSQMLRAGYPLSQVTEALCQRWQPGARLLPASDDRSETHVVITDPSDGEHRAHEVGVPPACGGQERHRAIHFQEWWVRFRAKVPTHSFAFIGADDASAGPGVADAIADADIVFLAPSNPVVSIGAILAVPGVRAALRSTRAPVIGYSPIVSGKPLRGMADECLRVIGVASTSEAVGDYYGARSGTGILDGWLIHDDDRAEIPGVTVRAIPLLMTSPAATAEMVRSGLEMAGLTSGPRS
jgi:LPPG:FO 2-phospho-L-lactate transferase